MTVSFITVGSLKESYLKEAVAEYKKRITQYARVEEIELKEERVNNEEDPKEIARALDREGEKILTQLQGNTVKVALCVEGKQYSSEELAELVKGAQDKCGRITFIIGSSHGLSPAVKAAADHRLSFSRLTFPHQLMRVNLYEATYRSFTIIAGKKYHK